MTVLKLLVHSLVSWYVCSWTIWVDSCKPHFLHLIYHNIIKKTFSFSTTAQKSFKVILGLIFQNYPILM
jgi:flagellar biosynthesis protein FlhB